MDQISIANLIKQLFILKFVKISILGISAVVIIGALIIGALVIIGAKLSF